MTQWYYASHDRQRLGPVGTRELQRLLQSGQIHAQTLLWREGFEGWRPLRECASELDVAVTAPAHPHTPQQKRLPGCGIAAIVGAGLVLVAIPVLAILAAVAIPAYQDYVKRAKVSEAYLSSLALMSPVAEHIASNGVCPGLDEIAMDPTELNRYLASAVVGEFGSGTCGIELQLGQTGIATLDGYYIWLEYEPDVPDWSCSSNLPNRYLPVECRDWAAAPHADDNMPTPIEDTGASVDMSSRARNPPEYPASAVLAGVEGTVILLIGVDADGKVTDVRVERSSRNRDLDFAAVHAARRWHFNPAVVDGRRAPGVVRIPVDFSLGD